MRQETQHIKELEKKVATESEPHRVTPPKAPKPAQSKRCLARQEPSKAHQVSKLDVPASRGEKLPQGPTPVCDTKIRIHGEEGYFAFKQNWLMGRDDYYLVTKWEERADRMSPLHTVDCSKCIGLP